MIDYYESLLPDDQQKLRNSVQLLYRQTFILERKYDRRSGRSRLNRDYVECEKHMEFLRDYFSLMDIDVVENTQMGVIYLRGETVVGEKMSRLATLYVLVLKLIYDEQMSAVSTSADAVATLGEIHEKLGTYRLLKKQPSQSELRRTITFLKKYQLIEPLGSLDELDGSSRFVIYPAIHVVLQADDARELLKSFEESREDGEDGTTEDEDGDAGRLEYGGAGMPEYGTAETGEDEADDMEEE